MHFETIRFIVGTMALLGLSGGVLSAQAVSDSVPRELALALVGGFGRGDAATIQVATAADGLQAALVPAEATVLGSLTRSMQSTTILVLPHREDEARRMVQGRLGENGFVAFAPEPRSRGFVVSGLGAYTGGQYCRGDEGILVTVRRRERGGSLAWLVHTAERGSGGPCTARRTVARNFMDEVPVPALIPPDGFRSDGGGSGGGGDTYSLTTRLVGNGTNDAVVRHYTAQLVADGWVATERTNTNGAAYQLLRRDDAGKLAWSAVLLAVGPVGQGPMDVSLNLRRH